MAKGPPRRIKTTEAATPWLGCLLAPGGLVQPASRALPRPEAAGSPTHFQEQGPEAPVRVAAEAPGCAVVSKDVPSPPPSQSLELSRSLGFSWL